MSSTVRIGIIGAGWWATEAHIPGVLNHPDARLVAVCDPNAERLQKAASAYSIDRTYSSHLQMLDQEELDGVIIVTPHATHYELARACLERNLHILVEKPLTLYARDARDLIRTAQARGVVLTTGYNLNFSPQAQRARAAVLNGELGVVQYVVSSFSSDMTHFLGGGVSRDNAPVRFAVNEPGEGYNQPQLLGGGQGHLQLTHSVGLLLFITDLKPQRVQAMMNNLGLKVDMVDAFSVAFDNGALGLVGGTGNAGRNYRMALAVYGSEGCYLADSLAQVAFLRSKDGHQEDLLPGDTLDYPTTKNFIDVILGRAVSQAPGEIAWRAVELLDAAYRSAQNQGQPVNVEDLY